MLLKRLNPKKLDYALEKYRLGEITPGRAGEMLRIPLRRMLLIAAECDLPAQYSLRDLEKDIGAVR